MDLQMVLDILLGIVTGIHVKTILGLILLDVVLGVSEAIKLKKFDLYFVADFYRTMVVPYVLAFTGLVLAAKLISVDLLGPAGYLVGDAAQWAAWLTIVGNIGDSIVGHVKGLAIPVPEAEENIWRSEP